MASPTTGSDTQLNYLSVSHGIAGLWEGGPNATSAPLPVNGQIILAPATCDATLKICDDTADLTLNGLYVYQGAQDCVNLNNHASDISLQGSFGLGATSGLRVFTVKGGCSSIKLAGIVYRHGTSEDIKIDDWSDQSYNHSTGIDLSGLKSSDGKTLTVVARFGAEYTLGAGCTRAFWSSLGLTAYWWFKWTARKLTGVKVGQQGPSWLA